MQRGETVYNRTEPHLAPNVRHRTEVRDTRGISGSESLRRKLPCYVSQGHPVRLLIVEDSALIRKVTPLAFPRGSPRSIRRRMAWMRPRCWMPPTSLDAIILDLRMSNMNGVEFIRALPQRPRQRDTPVVITTNERKCSELFQ